MFMMLKQQNMTSLKRVSRADWIDLNTLGLLQVGLGLLALLAKLGNVYATTKGS